MWLKSIHCLKTFAWKLPINLVPTCSCYRHSFYFLESPASATGASIAEDSNEPDDIPTLKVPIVKLVEGPSFN